MRAKRTISAVLVQLSTVMCGTTHSQEMQDFVVESGADSPVCAAYARALNQARFPRPYCDRTFRQPLDAFSAVNITALTEDEIRQHYFTAEGLFMYGNTRHFSRKQTGAQRSDQEMARLLESESASAISSQRYMRENEKIPMYYFGSADVDNDAAAENLLFWKAHNIACGRDGIRTATNIAVLNGSGELDVDRTRLLFGPDEPRPKIMRTFPQLFQSMGIVQFEQRTYIDGFYLVQPPDSDTVQEKLGLAIFENGIRRRVCTFTFSAHDPED